VGEMSGRVEMLEASGQRVDAALDECRKTHATTTAELRRVRERLAVQEKRTSGQAFPSAKEDP
jgi:hypothetical protein